MTDVCINKIRIDDMSDREFGSIVMDKKFTTDPVPGSYVFNQALVTLVLQEANAGRIQRCKALGFTHELILKLQSLSPTDLHRLISSPYLWIKPSIDREALENILKKMERDDELERLMNRTLKLGATSPMMAQFFGLTHTESAARRRGMGVKVRSGRLSALTNEQKHACWHRWVSLVQQHENENRGEATASIFNTSSGENLDELNQLDLMLMIAEEQDILVGQVWLELSQIKAREGDL